MSRNFVPALVSAVVLVSCASPAASPTQRSLASTGPSFVPSGDASPTPTRSIGTSGATGGPSAPPAIRVPAWHATGTMVSPHAFHTATLLRDGGVLVVGGKINDGLHGSASAFAERYDPTTGSWTATMGITQARWDHTATLLPNGKVLVAGGYADISDPLASAELYDPSDGRWTAIRDMSMGRGGHTATLLLDGRVLVVGGGAEETRSEGGPRSATGELYNPATGEWTATGSMTEARTRFTATLLPDGTVLVTGGDGSFTAAELYHRGTGQWTATGSMAEGRIGHTATLLPDGTVLVTGGCACSDPGAGERISAELYDPDSGRWTATGSMGTARIFHTATLLADGTVLVVDDSLLNRPASAELYDPRSGRWAPTASPARARIGYTATLLSNGMVLLVGDYDHDSLAPAELYDPGSGS